MTSSADNDWNVWSKHVLLELERLNRQHEEMAESIADIRLKAAVLTRLTEVTDKLEKELAAVRSTDLAQLRTDLSLLQVKAGLWGLLAGAIPGMVVALMLWSKLPK